MFFAMAFGVTGCGKSLNALDRLAAAGTVDRSAPVCAHVETEINAPPAKVWALLINAPGWPQWQEQIESVSSAAPLGRGARFTWKTGGMTIHSQVQLFDPERRLAWTGTAFTAKAAHAWYLEAAPGGRTQVIVDESMDGFLMSTLYSSQKLVEADHDWLNSLKQAAEKAQ